MPIALWHYIKRIYQGYGIVVSLMKRFVCVKEVASSCDSLIFFLNRLRFVKTNSIRKAVYRILAMVDEFYAKDEDGISSLEKEFERTNQFIATSLKIVAEKGGLPWRKS